MAEQEFDAEIELLRTHRSLFRKHFLKQALASPKLTTDECKAIGTWYTNQNRPTWPIKLKDRVLASIKEDWQAGGNPLVYVENWFRKNYKSVLLLEHSQPWKKILDFFENFNIDKVQACVAHLIRQNPPPASTDIRLI